MCPHPPTYFPLSPELERWWHGLLTTHHPDVAIATVLEHGLRWWILPCLPRDADADLNALALRLIWPLAQAVRRKLAQHFKREATPQPDALVRANAQAALKMIVQALLWTYVRLLKDRAEHPRDPLAVRVARLCAAPMAPFAGDPDPTLDAWRMLVETRDPVTVCRDAISRELETRVLPAFPEPDADYQGYARTLTRPLVDQVLTKLTALFPDKAKRGVTALIRAKKDAAYKACAEAVEEAATLYAHDHRAHPEDRLATRVSRLDAAIRRSSLESWQGKSADRVGELGDYALLFTYEPWLADITRVFPERTWAPPRQKETPISSAHQSQWRRMMLEKEQADGQLPWAEVLLAASKARTREEAVLIILSRTAPLARGRSPASLTRPLKRARRRLAELFPRQDTPESPPNGR
jgi:hypothetical protein